MTLYRLTLAGFDAVNPAATVMQVQLSCSAAGVVLPASNGTIEAFDNRILSDPLQMRSFRFVMLAGLQPDGTPLTFTPQANDILRTTEGLYRLLGATPLDPAGQGPILFNVGCTLDVQLVIP